MCHCVSLIKLCYSIVSGRNNVCVNTVLVTEVFVKNTRREPIENGIRYIYLC